MCNLQLIEIAEKFNFKRGWNGRRENSNFSCQLFLHLLCLLLICFYSQGICEHTQVYPVGETCTFTIGLICPLAAGMNQTLIHQCNASALVALLH